MKLYKSLLRVLLLSAIVLPAFLINPAAAQQRVVQETFDDPLLPGWEHSPEVIVTDGVLRIGPANFAALMGSWGDFDLTFRLRGLGYGEIEINYRATDAGSYALRINPEEVFLLKAQAGSEPIGLAHAGASQIPIQDWIEVHILLQGGEHQIAVDGNPLFNATDPEPLPPGALTFAARGERILELDDLSLQPIIREPGQGGEAPVVPSPLATTAPTPEAAAPTTWGSFLSNLTSSQGSTLDIPTVAINLLLAVITSFILSRVYVYWGASLSNRRKFAANFMLVSVTTTFIILIVRSSVALSLGLVGALSIIRFRAAIKEPEELAYLFFAISLGIGLGDNQRLITLAALLVVIVLIGLARLLRQTQADANLHLGITSRNPNKVEMPQVMDLLAKHCSKLQLLRYDENADTLEMSFIVEFAHTSDLNQARNALLALAPTLEISFLDNKGIW